VLERGGAALPEPVHVHHGHEVVQLRANISTSSSSAVVLLLWTSSLLKCVRSTCDIHTFEREGGTL
jgi:hypothetical protein